MVRNAERPRPIRWETKASHSVVAKDVHAHTCTLPRRGVVTADLPGIGEFRGERRISDHLIEVRRAEKTVIELPEIENPARGPVRLATGQQDAEKTHLLDGKR
jgi:hypothetical protein